MRYFNTVPLLPCGSTLTLLVVCRHSRPRIILLYTHAAVMQFRCFFSLGLPVLFRRIFQIDTMFVLQKRKISLKKNFSRKKEGIFWIVFIIILSRSLIYIKWIKIFNLHYRKKFIEMIDFRKKIKSNYSEYMITLWILIIIFFYNTYFSYYLIFYIFNCKIS